ncbi:MAG: dicarboxylate/amino acid:cation symporter [Deltaproteobacteria bacterium]|nr:dicarboxylate/amino acid:cation symporter [Deltaproteobacteria bacterium]
MNNHTNLTSRIVIAMLLGLMAGLAVKLFLPDNTFVQTYCINGLCELVGNVFISALKMVVVPLVFVSLVCGTCSLRDTAMLGRLGVKTMGLYLATTAIAVSLALGLAVAVKPGAGVQMSGAQYVPTEAPGLLEVVGSIIPSNPLRALAEGNMLQIIVFSMLFGVAISLTGKAGERIAQLFQDLNEVVIRLVLLLMAIAPYGVFCLMAKMFATVGFDTIFSLIRYFVLVIVALILHAAITFPLMLRVFVGISPWAFYKKMRPAMLFAFSTASSSATLPVTMETATRRLGVRNSIASFTLPLGATLNMDGTAIMQGIATVFIAQVYAIDLSAAQCLMVVVTATLASIGTAAVPSAGMIMLAMVLQQVGLPVEGIALIIGVDRLLDMTRTAVNVAGDCTVSCIVAGSEGEFDRDVFLQSSEQTEDSR